MQNKKPLTPTQVFQDVPSDHAFKTMTMETFPHSGQLLASVHPCKHASVMKKFIDRMDAAQRDHSPSPSQDTPGQESSASGASGKKKWGLGGMVKRVTGNVPTVNSLKKAADAGDAKGEGEPTGLQVDFYLVIVSSFFQTVFFCGKVADSRVSIVLEIYCEHCSDCRGLSLGYIDEPVFRLLISSTL